MPEKIQITLEDAQLMAEKHHQSGNLTMAEQAYRDIIASIPDDFRSLHYLAVTLYQQGNSEEGLPFIKRSVELKGNDPKTLNAYAVMLAQAGHKQEAIEKWHLAIKINPKYAEAYTNLSHAHWELGEYEDALQAGLKATQHKKDYIDGLLNLGNAYAALKKYDEAVDTWKKSIKISPQNPDAYINIGNALRDNGQIRESEKYCKIAVEQAPQNPTAYRNLANAKFDLGNNKEAEELYRKMIALDPAIVDGHSNLALVLMKLLRYEEAVTSLKFAIALDNKRAKSYAFLASALLEMGVMRDAENAGRKALALNPESADARIDLADILFVSDRNDEAAALLNDALEMSEESPRIYMKLSSVMEKTNQVEKALEAVDKAIELSPDMPDAHMRKAQIYLSSNQAPKALETINNALELNSDSISSLSVKSDILQALGRMEDAQETVRKGLAISNEIPSLYFLLSKTKKIQKGDDDYKNLMALADKGENFGLIQNIALHFSLHHVHETNKDYEDAFKHLQIATELKRSSLVFDRNEQRETFEHVKTTHPKKTVNLYKNVGYQDESPIFIVGMPRSGTTLTEQIISSHPEIFGAGELPYLGQAELTHNTMTLETAKDIGEHYIKLTRSIDEDAAKARFITDKMPSNYVRIGQIIATLPNAKIIHCRRNPIDTCLSCYKQLFARGHYWSYNLQEIAEYYTLYMDMMAHWRDNFPDKFIEINYEDTVGDFENQARMLIDYIGVEWDDACLSPHKNKRTILTASKAQVIQPVYKTSVEGWRRYEEQLQPLADMLDKFIGEDKKQKDL